MAASDFRDVGPNLATGLGRAPPQSSFDPAPKQPFDTWIGVVIAAIIVIAIIAGHSIAQHRRKIARVADEGVISGLATGLRVVRRARSAKEALINRVMRKADQETDTGPDAA